jgi:sporulation protein YlmC with PRC-barrel domain
VSRLKQKLETLMKQFLMTTALVAGSVGAAFAQDASTLFRTTPEATEIRASNLIGMRIYREEGEAMGEAYNGLQEGWDDIGEINDLILSREGEVQAVLVDIGGFLGMGESQVAVDMQSIRFVSDDATDVDDFFLVLNAPREVFETAPTYDMSAMDGTATGVDDPNVADTATAAQTTVDPNAPMATDPNAQTSVDATGQTTMDPNATAADPNAQVATDTTGQTTVDPNATQRDGWSEVAATDLTSESLTGATVYGANEESIGEVSDLVLTEDGQIQAAIVDVGGFLGIGEKPVQLDLTELDIVRDANGNEVRIYIGMTREQVEALPSYEG